jgi:signal transduction histidine kinase
LVFNERQMPHSGNNATSAVPTTRPWLFLGALLLADLFFIGLHVFHTWSPWLKSWMFSIEQDRALAELFQYAKQALLALGSFVLFLRTRGWIFLAWAVFFGFLMLDDMLEFHERVGKAVGPALGLPGMFGLRMDDYGEMAYAAVLGLCLVTFLALALRRGGPVERRFSADLLCLLAALALFAVVFDALHTIAYFRVPLLAHMLALLEDGGELIVMSLITAYVADTLHNAGNPRIGVWRWVRARLGRDTP